LERIRGFGHRIGAPLSKARLDDQVFSVLALLDAYETTLDPRYFSPRKKRWTSLSPDYGDAEGAAFSIVLRRRADGWPRRSSQALPGFADAQRQFVAALR